MGFRFTKRIRIAKGLNLNIGKKSVGISAGFPGARISKNSSGDVTSSVGIPGTGASFRSTKRASSRSEKMPKANYKTVDVTLDEVVFKEIDDAVNTGIASNRVAFDPDANQQLEVLGEAQFLEDLARLASDEKEGWISGLIIPMPGPEDTWTVGVFLIDNTYAVSQVGVLSPETSSRIYLELSQFMAVNGLVFPVTAKIVPGPPGAGGFEIMAYLKSSLITIGHL